MYNLISFVRTQFITTQNDIGFASEKAQIISFVERGFERLSLGHRMVVCRGIHIELNCVHSRSLSPGGGLGGSGSWPFFLAPSFRTTCFPFYISLYPLSYVHV